MSDLSVQGNKAAWGGGGAQAFQTTKIDARQAQEITKTAGFSFSSGNDFSIPLTYKTKDQDGNEVTGKVFITPDSLKDLKEVASGTQRAENKMGSSTPITVMQNGKSLGTIDPSEILSK